MRTWPPIRVVQPKKQPVHLGYEPGKVCPVCNNRTVKSAGPRDRKGDGKFGGGMLDGLMYFCESTGRTHHSLKSDRWGALLTAEYSLRFIGVKHDIQNRKTYIYCKGKLYKMFDEIVLFARLRRIDQAWVMS